METASGADSGAQRWKQQVELIAESRNGNNNKSYSSWVQRWKQQSSTKSLIRLELTGMELDCVECWGSLKTHFIEISPWKHLKYYNLNSGVCGILNKIWELWVAKFTEHLTIRQILHNAWHKNTFFFNECLDKKTSDVSDSLANNW